MREPSGSQPSPSSSAPASPRWAMVFPERAARWQDRWPIERSLEICTRGQVRAVEIGHGRIETLDEPEQVHTIRRIREAGIDVISLHMPFLDDAPLDHPDRPRRLAAVDRTRRLLRTCQAGGIGLAVIHPASRSCPDPQAARSHLLRSLEELLPAAEQAGVTLCLENMLPHHVIGVQPGEIASILAEFDHPRLRAVFDSGHAHATGRVLEVFESMRPYIAHVHLHDNEGDVDLHLSPGYGTIPWPVLLPRLVDLALPVPLFVEAPPWSDHADYVRQQLELTALANACLGSDRYPSLRRPGESQWWLRRDPLTGRLVVFDDRGQPI